MRRASLFALFGFASFILSSIMSPSMAELQYVPQGDKAMASAFAKAQKTLDRFLSTAKNPDKDSSKFVIKVYLKDKHGSEYIWVGPFKQKGDKFEGRLMNTPVNIKIAKYGETVHFTKSQIKDWGYHKKGKILGNFTTCVLLEKMPKAQSARYYKMGFTCTAQ